MVIVPGIGVAGVLAAIAALFNATRALVALFVVSFFPFGLYLLLTPGIFRWIGVARIGYGVGAVLLGRRCSSPS